MKKNEVLNLKEILFANDVSFKKEAQQYLEEIMNNNE